MEPTKPIDLRTFFENKKHDPKNPDPWLALYLDKSLPIPDKVKAAFLRGQGSRTRRVVLPLVRPVARLAISGIKLAKLVTPRSWQSSSLLHRSIYWGLRTFAAPEASYLILRHFNIGTELLRFIADNVPGVSVESTQPLRPQKLEDLLANTFLIHDLNIYNFLIELNSKLRAQGRELAAPSATEETEDGMAERPLDFSAITDAEVPIEALPNTWLNVVDLQTAIEIYTPLYALFLSDEDFWRASNSLQLDEIIAMYVDRILGTQLHVALVHNRHPMVPRSTLEAGFRLTLHGLDAEALHGYLRQAKAQAAGQVH